MVNIIITLFIFILLVTQKILLLNEESLILLCFIAFIVLGLNNLGTSLNNSLQTQSLQIKENLTQSLKKLLLSLQKFSTLKQNSKVILKKFNELKIYYLNLVSLLENLIPFYNKYYLTLSYSKRLTFINKIEKQTIKLLTAVIIKKLNTIIKSKHFYNSSIQFTQFICLNTILLRECIQLISLKKN